jgi:ABC-type phosphate transport system substrate-binding protein
MTETSADGSTTRRRLLAAVGAAGVGLAGCTQSGAGGGDGLSGTTDIAGSSTVFRVATAMAERFGSGHSGVDINRQSTGAGGGFANHVCPGRTDFNNASGTDDSLIEAILGEEGPGHRQDYSATGQDRTIIQGVEGSEGAIGYLGFAYYSQNTDRVKAVGIDDGDGCVEPSPETARTGEYTPLSRLLFTYPKRESLSEEHVAEFARFWLENATGEAIIADEVGHVPLSDDAQSEVRIHTPRRGMTLAVSAEGHTRTTHGPTVCG